MRFSGMKPEQFKAIVVALLVTFLPASTVAQTFEVPPTIVADAPAEPDAIPLYGANSPGSPSTENWAVVKGYGIYSVRNVTKPTLTPFLPDPEKATGAAVIVAPGGAFMGLSITHEGTAVAEALAKRGIAAFVLKYRLLPTPASQQEADAYIGARMRGVDRNRQADGPRLSNPDATKDALTALALVRARASEWDVDRDRVGMIGFSAGAMTSLEALLTGGKGKGPAFVGYIYGPQDAVDVPSDAAPLFDAIALNDPLFASNGFPIVHSWLNAGRSVELHAYQKGRHGFGLGFPGTTSTLMLTEFTTWLDMLGFLKPTRDD